MAEQDLERALDALGVDDNRSVWIAEDRPAARASLSEAVSADIAIIGGGFTGVSTAYQLAKRHPDKGIVLLEARQIGNGASGRNGGLVLNQVSGLYPDNEETARLYYDFTSSGIDLIEGLIAEHSLDAYLRRQGCLEVLTNERRAEQAALEVEWKKKAGLAVEFLDRSAMEGHIALEGACGAILDKGAGQMNGWAFVTGMGRVLDSLGVRIFENSPVLRIEEGSTIRISTPGGEVRASAIVLATNGYTGRIGYFNESIIPLHSHLLATAQMTDAELQDSGWKASVGFDDDLDRLSYGSQTKDGRIVFGGGSNAAYSYLFGSRTKMNGEVSGAFDAIQDQLGRYLPKTKSAEITHRWSGTLGVTMTRVPAMGVRGDHENVYYALGYSGSGIVISNLAGIILADLYSGDADKWTPFPFFQRRPGWIPPEPFRWLGYQFYTVVTGRSPRRSYSHHG